VVLVYGLIILDFILRTIHAHSYVSYWPAGVMNGLAFFRFVAFFSVLMFSSQCDLFTLDQLSFLIAS